MISGTAYGVVLNDRDQLAALGPALSEAPYGAPPDWPVVYIKPRTCFSFGGAPVLLPSDCDHLSVASTVGILLGRDAANVRRENAPAYIGAMCVALDVCTARDDYYRPAIAQSCRDGFLPLGALAAASALPDEIVTRIDGAIAHRWALSRLVRPVERLIADMSSYMTLRAGDLLLIGLPGDAPRAFAGQDIEISAGDLPALRTRIAAPT